MPSSDYDEEIPRSKSMNDEIPLTLKRICYKIVSQIYAEEFIDVQYRGNSYKPVHFIPVDSTSRLNLSLCEVSFILQAHLINTQFH